MYQEGRRKKNSKTDIFERRYYEIMFLPFFLNMDDQLQFEPAQELLTYAQQLEANKLQQATIELQQTESPYIEKRRSYGCCGLVRSGTQ